MGQNRSAVFQDFPQSLSHAENSTCDSAKAISRLTIYNALLKAGGTEAVAAHLKSRAAVEIFAAVKGCQTVDGLKAVGELLSRVWTEKRIGDEEAECLSVCIANLCAEPCKAGIQGLPEGVGRRYRRFHSRPSQRSPDAQKSRERRRTLGGSSALPPKLRAFYTEGMRAVLFVVSEQIKRKALCDLPIDKIAAMAGVCRTTVQNALHLAQRLGHVLVTARPQCGRKNLTNIVKVVSAEWKAWLARGAAMLGRIGSKALNAVHPTEREIYINDGASYVDTPKGALEETHRQRWRTPQPPYQSPKRQKAGA